MTTYSNPVPGFTPMFLEGSDGQQYVMNPIWRSWMQNLNQTVAVADAKTLEGKTWESPGAIGSTSPNAGHFTTLQATGTLTLKNGTAAAPAEVFAGSSTTGCFWANPGIGFSVAGSSVGTFTATGLNSTAVGVTTPSTGSFTTLAASSTVSGSGFTTLFASPPPIGNTTPSSGAFTTLSATSTVNGAGFTALFASPPPIGSTVASSGAFTTLTASSTVSGAGITALFASPPSLGSTAPAAVTGTTLTASSGAITPHYPSGIVGNKTGSGPTAGSLGESISSNATSVSTPNATDTIITSISLTAGVWIVFGNVCFNFAGGASAGGLFTAISTSSSISNPTYTYSSLQQTFTNQTSLIPPTTTYNFGSTTTVNLLAHPNFAGGSMSADGIITALRIG